MEMHGIDAESWKIMATPLMLHQILRLPKWVSFSTKHVQVVRLCLIFNEPCGFAVVQKRVSDQF